MRIQHNVMAMNAYRNYSNNTSALSKNLEKLSSGYKINRAGDDAAGLAISEKMRAQITGLEAAQKNVKDGISLVNTAEGALQEVQNMLNRMVYLAQESANGTFDDAVDRKALQDEINQLTEEIDRIADSANFNGIFLLNGKSTGNDAASTTAPTAKVDDTNAAKLGKVTVAFDKDATDEQKTALAEALKGDFKFTTTDEGDNSWGDGDTIKIDKLPTGYTAKIKSQDGTKDIAVTANGTLTTGTGDDKIDSSKDLAIDLYDKDNKKVATITVGKPIAGAAGTSTVTFSAADAAASTTAAAPTLKENTTGKKLADYGIKSIDFTGVEVEAETDVKVEYDADDTDGTLKVTVGDKTYSYKAADTAANLTGAADKEVELAAADGKKIKVTLAKGQTLVGNDKNTDTTDDIALAAVGKLAPAADSSTDTAGPGVSLTLQIGDSSATYNQLTVSIKDMHSYAMGDGTTTIKQISVATQTAAQAAVDVIKGAINYVSDVRGTLGALSNRLDHTSQNLSVMRENITDAESSIRDTDVAEEMMAYTKNNILVQSAQAMLAQANQVPQGVLQLLQ